MESLKAFGTAPMYVCMCIHMYIVLKMHLRGHHVCVFIACGLKIIAADVEHGAIASQTWGSSDALSNEDVRREGAQLGELPWVSIKPT